MANDQDPKNGDVSDDGTVAEDSASKKRKVEDGAMDNLSVQTEKEIVRIAHETLQHLKEEDGKAVLELTEQVGRQAMSIHHLTQRNHQYQHENAELKIRNGKAHQKLRNSEKATEQALKATRQANEDVRRLRHERNEWRDRAHRAEGGLANIQSISSHNPPASARGAPAHGAPATTQEVRRLTPFYKLSRNPPVPDQLNQHNHSNAPTGNRLYHGHIPLQDHSPNGDGKIRPYQYGSNAHWDLGLCYTHFYTPHRCEHGQDCEWRHSDLNADERTYIMKICADGEGFLWRCDKNIRKFN
ncbi:hypothetical protein P154DRAFT_569766 [Amniculicola lignicola CBS 123094]|uniref:C3H1-type domain-containing protein n=1 Tax=Amniculicola lignicola CBS 123094 TaxID=1392246 RepID=A0A6A5X2F3_9PLEO|nr:hypothetical protein P154DRAFT_569766 [Amniculicola lignicola CBS 123094]